MRTDTEDREMEIEEKEIEEKENRKKLGFEYNIKQGKRLEKDRRR